MDDKNIKELLEKLLQGTLSGRHKWSMGSESAFALNFPKSSIVLLDNSNKGHPPEMKYILSIHNAEGKAIEKLYVDDLIKAAPNALDLLKRIVAAINDQAYGISDTLDDVFKNI